MHRSTIQLLRFKFSFFLLPVYCFALSFVSEIDWFKAGLIFVLLHLFLYPASNGYNSYMDRDEDSIGGIAKPMQPTRQLFHVTIAMDVISAALSFFVSAWFAAAYIFYIICSRLYSYRGIRLKRFAIAGYLTVILNQGALTFAMVYYGASTAPPAVTPWHGIIAASFLIGGFYPITQVYQHESDAKDGVNTISMLLGKQGTFIFCGIMYCIAFCILFFYYNSTQQISQFFILQLFFIPVVIYFLRWFIQVAKNRSMADFKHTMQMNWLASSCTNLAFITLIILHQLG